MIAVPTLEVYGREEARDYLVEIEGGASHPIEGFGGRPNANHVDVRFAWSEDSRHLLWVVEGKWGPLSIVHLTFENGRIRQMNVLEAGQEEIVDRLEKAKPWSYLKAWRENYGMGDAYPKGFTVDVLFDRERSEPPLEFRFGLTSNPKRIGAQITVEAYLTGRIDEKGELQWGDFSSHGPDDILVLERHLDQSRKRLWKVQNRLAAALPSGEARADLEAEQVEWDASAREDPVARLSFENSESVRIEWEACERRIEELSRRIEEASAARR